jgi:hypothetical protein
MTQDIDYTNLKSLSGKEQYLLSKNFTYKNICEDFKIAESSTRRISFEISKTQQLMMKKIFNLYNFDGRKDPSEKDLIDMFIFLSRCITGKNDVSFVNEVIEYCARDVNLARSYIVNRTEFNQDVRISMVLCFHTIVAMIDSIFSKKIPAVN